MSSCAGCKPVTGLQALQLLPQRCSWESGNRLGCTSNEDTWACWYSFREIPLFLFFFPVQALHVCVSLRQEHTCLEPSAHYARGACSWRLPMNMDASPAGRFKQSHTSQWAAIATGRQQGCAMLHADRSQDVRRHHEILQQFRMPFGTIYRF